MEKEYIYLFVSKPYWDGNKWSAWTSQSPIDDGYRIKIPLPEELEKPLIEAELDKS